MLRNINIKFLTSVQNLPGYIMKIAYMKGFLMFAFLVPVQNQYCVLEIGLRLFTIENIPLWGGLNKEPELNKFRE